ncbi:VOC family protein [Pseudoalteromonas sp.]|uniref:VOC family protein n=1 Tax=Pseudoalteromonas sp. TaxID=53249 RepID=UPI00356781B2
MNKHEKLNYVEFPATDLAATKAFFSQAFNWQFTDYGTEYTAFNGEGLSGGFFQSPLASTTATGGALLVFFSNDIHTTQRKVTLYGGKIVKPIYEFPGGCRFHFTEPSGNEFAVWAEQH